MLAWAQRITADAESLEQEASRLRQALVGRLRLGVVPAALPAVPILASPLARRHPGVTLTVVSSTSIDIQAGLDEFRLEAGITYLDNEPLSHVRAIPLYREQYLLITPRGGPLAGGSRVTWREAASLPLCLLTPDMQNRRILNAHFAEAGVTGPPGARDQLGLHPLHAGALGLLVERAAARLPADAVGRARASPSSRWRGPPAAHTVGLVVSDRDPPPPTVDGAARQRSPGWTGRRPRERDRRRAAG